MDFNNKDIILYKMGMMGTLRGKGAPIASIKLFIEMMKQSLFFPSGLGVSSRGMKKKQISVFAAGYKKGKTILNDYYGINGGVQPK